MSVDMEFNFSNIEEELSVMVKGIGEIEDEIITQSTKLVRDKMKLALKYKVSKISTPGYKHIKDDIKMSGIKDDKLGTRYREIYGGKTTGYKWKYLEYGTVKMSPFPFIQPVLDNTTGEREQIAFEKIKKVIEK